MQRLSESELQRQTLRLYGALVTDGESWAGKLVVTCGEGSTASGLPAAVSIAGGTTLVVDPDMATVKAVFRRGGVDFVVNTLDEALRVLKNEVRRKRPLSVALVAETQPVVAEMVERGVLPNLVVESDHGCETEEWVAAQRLRVGSERLEGWLAERGWSEAVLSAGPATEPRALDARLLEMLPEGDAVRRAWVQRIGHYQRGVSEGERVIWLTVQEREELGLASR